jgi:hypothetical protein
MAVMMLTQSTNGFTIRGLRQAEEQGSREDRDAGCGEDEPPVPLTSRLHEDPSSRLHGQGDDACASAQTPR